jgi:2-methylcitrate dehydratase
MEKLQTQEMARFVSHAAYKDLDPDIVDQLKKHLLDSMGSLLYATQRPTIQKLAAQIRLYGESGICKVPGLGNLPPDRAAQFYTALIRYPDYMDNFLGKESTCHPSDNIGALLSASQKAESSGKDFLLAMAIGYALECRLIEEVPVMMKGFDHTLLLSYSLTGALGKLLSLSEEQTTHALGIAGCSFNPLVTSRASYTYEWKGLVSSFVALGVYNIVTLAQQGITGPISLFEGPKGFKEIFGMELSYDWQEENFELIRKCALKSYNSEVHTQSILEAVLEMKEDHAIAAEEIKDVKVTTFLTSYHIVGGGLYGDRKEVRSKEQADHSLPYLVAVAFLDGKVEEPQLLPERINRQDVQELLQKIEVGTCFPISKPVKIVGMIDPYTSSYPEKLKCKVEVCLKNDMTFSNEKEDFKGYYTRPFSWEDTENKFRRLAQNVISLAKQDALIETIQHLEDCSMKELIDLFNV